MIVVIDTNVWISALHFGKNFTNPVKVVERALRSHTIATAPEINAEVARILVEKFKWHLSDAQRILADYFQTAMVVTIPGTLRVCRDPNDDMILECAIAAGAQGIISGDKDLLALNPYEGIRILTPSEFLALET